MVLATTRFRTAMPASFGELPCRIASTARNDPSENKFDSPRPVEPAVPISPSTYKPAPTIPLAPAVPIPPSTYKPAPRIGESPPRPGIFQARPLVVVTPQPSPLVFTAVQLMVNTKGEVCGVTTTSGLAWKIPGRVGDS